MLQKGLYFWNNQYYNITNDVFRRLKNMSTVLNYQLSIFGAYSIEPSPENITVLMKKINEATGESFLPNLISGQKVEIPANRITTISNLGYVTQNQKYNIAILDERIDIGYNRIDTENIEIIEFYDFAVKALGSIMNHFELKAHRLAANIQLIADGLSETQIIDLGKHLVVGAQYYNDKAYIEWSTRVNSISSIHIAETEEPLNTILDMAASRLIQNQNLAFLYHLDVNTIPQRTSMRFETDSLSEFCNSIIPIANTIITDVERLISFE